MYPDSPHEVPQEFLTIQNGTPALSVPYPTRTTAWLSEVPQVEDEKMPEE
jgi:hypothetical protein